MPEYTMANTGAKGVELALVDSMEAVKANRENERLHVIIRNLEAHVAKLENKNKRQEATIKSLHEVCQNYQRIHIKAYTSYMHDMRDEVSQRAARVRNGLLCMLGGMIITGALVALVIMAKVG